MGAGERSNEGVICYQLGAVAATRRARALAALGVTTALAPLALAVGLLRRFAWTPTVPFWAVVSAVGVLATARALVQYRTTKRRLDALRVILDNEGIVAQTLDDAYAIPRARVARIIEIEGALGGLRVESEAEGSHGAVLVASVPRGGAFFGQVRERLEQWRTIERKRKHGPAKRFGLGVVIVAAIFFLPFLIDDMAGRSNVMVAVFVAVAWIATRWALRGR